MFKALQNQARRSPPIPGPLVARAAMYTAGVVGGLTLTAACAPSEKYLRMSGPLSLGLGAVVVASLGKLGQSSWLLAVAVGLVKPNHFWNRNIPLSKHVHTCAMTKQAMYYFLFLISGEGIVTAQSLGLPRLPLILGRV